MPHSHGTAEDVLGAPAPAAPAPATAAPTPATTAPAPAAPAAGAEPGPTAVPAAASAPARTVAPAPEESVPGVLREPPWTRRVVLEGLARDVAPALVWEPGEREEYADLGSTVGARAWSEVLRRPSWRWSEDWMELLDRAPRELVRPLLREGGAVLPDHGWNRDALRGLLGRYGDDVLPYVVRVAVRYGSFASVLLPVEGPAVALAFARWLARPPAVREVALTWLARHPDAAARDLVPVALSGPGEDRTAAGAALRRLAPEVVARAAAAYGPAAAQGVAALLHADPLDGLPERMPRVPAWLDPAGLPPLSLTGGRGALPVDAVTAVVQMLVLCRPGEPYTGVAVVRGSCEATSLARWCWAVFERWRAAGYPAGEDWVLEGLALCGDDQVARDLVPLVDAWSRGGARARARAGRAALGRLGAPACSLPDLQHLPG